jgi:hypothetical protein
MVGRSAYQVALRLSQLLQEHTGHSCGRLQNLYNQGGCGEAGHSGFVLLTYRHTRSHGAKTYKSY